MKKYFSLLILFLLNACASKAYKPESFYQIQSDAKIPVSITKFTNQAARTENSGHCRGWLWFSSDLGNAFQALTVDEFQNYPKLEVLERETIHQIYNDEVDLVNAEKSPPIKRGKFKRARYTVVGVVNSFEYCDGSTGLKAASMVSQSLLGAGFESETASVEVTMRLIDTETGSILGSAKGKGTQSRTSASFSALSPRLDVGSDLFRQSSLSDAIREAIHNGSTALFSETKL